MGFFLDHKYGPTALFLSADFAFSIMDAMTQLLERKGFPTGQVVFLRMVSCTTGKPCHCTASGPWPWLVHLARLSDDIFPHAT